MSDNRQPKLRIRQMFIAIFVGAAIACASAIAYSNSEQNIPFVPNMVVSAIALPVVPGYVLSAYIFHNIHDANLIFAGTINFFLYGGLSLWLMFRRGRRRSAEEPDIDR
jgi:hypothetical protein